MTTCLWGTLCGGALGAVRTRAAALHLLAKGRALEAAGVPSLPGSDHWGILASGKPALAGALFFGLSLGLGTGALTTLWVEATRRPGAGRGGWAPWTVLLAPLAGALSGDWGLAAALALVAAGALRAAGDPTPRGAAAGRRLACAAVAALGLVPWLLAPEGAFTRLRDRWLLSGPGLGVDHFYYRWTLYPAEALKALAAESQPVGDIGALPASAARSFAAQVLPLRVLALATPAPAADFAVELREGTPVVVAGRIREAWPGSAAEQRRVWQRLSQKADRAAPLRTATAMALFVGCPLGLAWALGSLCLWVAGRVAPARPVAPFVFAALLATVLAAAGTPSPECTARSPTTPEAVRAALASRSALTRFYGARAAASLGTAQSEPLIAALGDPVVNVRYAAVETLGATGGTGVEEALVGLVRGPEEWYVKERAYAALWRLGWRPVNL
ncbi:MAG: HEAT repeat domain-containing protein [Deltaproteobacteria bacterium]|nr:HEAT repeat domain-containing protein [Deltaproteobacteria bacterium]